MRSVPEILMAALGAVLLFATAGHAAGETNTIRFTASDFASEGVDVPAPYDTVSGVFAAALGSTGFGITGMTLTSLTPAIFNPSDTLSTTFAYSPYYLCPCVGGLTVSTDDKATGAQLVLSIPSPDYSPFGSSSSGAILDYTVDGVTYQSGVGSESYSVTPEPSTWFMLLMGFGLLGHEARRGRRRVAGIVERGVRKGRWGAVICGWPPLRKG